MGKTYLRATFLHRVIFFTKEIYPLLSCRLRSLGSAALNMCMVALGGADVFFEFGIHAWDIAAGDLIVREAGGVTTDPAGKHNCKILYA